MTKVSRLLSLVLRHKPEAIGLDIDKNGWAKVSDIVKKSDKVSSEQEIYDAVSNNDKNRFSLSDDKKRIRANQGHSISVDIQLDEKIPPNILYHGTTKKYLDSIFKNGLMKMDRNHVHLSKDYGSRHGKPVVLTIDAERMSKEGISFYQSVNGVWLTDYVMSEFITF